MMIVPADWRRVTEAFVEAQSADESSRSDLVRRVLAGRPDLVDEVLRLLAAHASADDFLERPVCALAPESAAEFDAEPSDFRLPQELAGEYELGEVLGAGSFGVVYRARQPSLEREVALKVSPDLGAEAQTLAGLDHPNIVRVHAVHRLPSGLRVTCLQHVDGRTLHDVMRDLPRGWRGKDFVRALGDEAAFAHVGVRRARLAELDGAETTALLAIELADALAHAHGKGVFHADVKPANVLVDRAGRPLLIDFNVARSPLTEAAPLEGVLGGTVGFMPPEQARRIEDPGSHPDIDEGRADIYALGKVILALLAGADSGGAIACGLAGIAARCVEEDPARRFATADALTAALRGYLDERKTARLLDRAPLARLARAFPVGMPLALAAAPLLAYFAACRLGTGFPVFAFLGPRTAAVYRACMGPVPAALALAVLAILTPDLRALSLLLARAPGDRAAHEARLARAVRVPLRLAILGSLACAAPLALRLGWEVVIDGRHLVPLMVRPLSVLLVTASFVPVAVACVALRELTGLVLLPWLAGLRAYGDAPADDARSSAPTRPPSPAVAWRAAATLAAFFAMGTAAYGILTFPLKRFAVRPPGEHFSLPALIAWAFPAVAVLVTVFVVLTNRRANLVATRVDRER
jgi:hypothetical protein